MKPRSCASSRSVGIGRPSTYAQIVSTIRDREYVELEERRFRPTPLGDVVSKLLVRVFPDIFKVEFTSRMETALDRIEEGRLHWRTLLGEFYPPFREAARTGGAPLGGDHQGDPGRGRRDL